MKLKIRRTHEKAIIVAVLAIILILILCSCNDTDKAYKKETVDYVNVPDVTSALVNDAEIMLEEAGLHLGDITIVAKSGFDDVGDCTVVEQKPEAGSQAKKGDSIDLVVDYIGKNQNGKSAQ